MNDVWYPLTNFAWSGNPWLTWPRYILPLFSILALIGTSSNPSERVELSLKRIFITFSSTSSPETSDLMYCSCLSTTQTSSRHSALPVLNWNCGMVWLLSSVRANNNHEKFVKGDVIPECNKVLVPFLDIVREEDQASKVPSTTRPISSPQPSHWVLARTSVWNTQVPGPYRMSVGCMLIGGGVESLLTQQNQLGVCCFQLEEGRGSRRPGDSLPSTRSQLLQLSKYSSRITKSGAGTFKFVLENKEGVSRISTFPFSPFPTPALISSRKTRPLPGLFSSNNSFFSKL